MKDYTPKGQNQHELKCPTLTQVSIEIKNVTKTVYFHKKRHFGSPLKQNKTFFVKRIRGFVDSEFVKICHDQVISLEFVDL